MVGEDDSYFGKGDLFFFLCNRFPDMDAAKNASLLHWGGGGGGGGGGEGTGSCENLYLYYEDMVDSFV